MPVWKAEKELIALRKWADGSLNIAIELNCTDMLMTVSPHLLKRMDNLLSTSPSMSRPRTTQLLPVHYTASFSPFPSHTSQPPRSAQQLNPEPCTLAYPHLT